MNHPTPCCVRHEGYPEGVQPCGEMLNDGAQCTRPFGHDGAHVACSVADHGMVVWPGR